MKFMGRRRRAVHPPRGRRSRTAARLALFATLLRVLAAASAFQLTGTVHIVRDFIRVVTVGHQSEENAEHEGEPNHDCPPGCPTCHHVHYSAASLPASIFAVTQVPVNEGIAAELGSSGGAPPGPFHASVYRPPRA
jgi:hypothetical protein